MYDPQPTYPATGGGVGSGYADLAADSVLRDDPDSSGCPRAPLRGAAVFAVRVAEGRSTPG